MYILASNEVLLSGSLDNAHMSTLTEHTSTPTEGDEDSVTLQPGQTLTSGRSLVTQYLRYLKVSGRQITKFFQKR